MGIRISNESWVYGGSAAEPQFHTELIRIVFVSILYILVGLVPIFRCCDCRSNPDPINQVFGAGLLRLARSVRNHGVEDTDKAQGLPRLTHPLPIIPRRRIPVSCAKGLPLLCKTPPPPPQNIYFFTVRAASSGGCCVCPPR